MTGLQLTRRQYYALCTMVLLSPLLHLVPRKTTAEAGCGGWLCALAVSSPIWRTVSSRSPNLGFILSLRHI